MITNYNSITSIKLVPIRSVKIDYLDDSNVESSIVISHLEAESSYSFTPMTRTNDQGAIITYGYKSEAVIYAPHNQDMALFALLTNIRNKIQSAAIALGSGVFLDDNSDPIAMPDAINAGNDEYILFANPSFNVTLESTELRNRLKIIIHIFGRLT